MLCKQENLNSLLCMYTEAFTYNSRRLLGATDNAAKEKWLIRFRLSEPKCKVVLKMSNIDL